MDTEAIREFLAGSSDAPRDPEQPFGREELAAAALLVECARIDREGIDPGEREAICRAVREEFSLDHETAESLVAVAEKRQDEVWHRWLFTETVKRSFNEAAKLRIIRRLWEVAFADYQIHPHELDLIARIARELGIQEEAIHESREWVRERMGIAGREPRE